MSPGGGTVVIDFITATEAKRDDGCAVMAAFDGRSDRLGTVAPSTLASCIRLVALARSGKPATWVAESSILDDALLRTTLLNECHSVLFF